MKKKIINGFLMVALLAATVTSFVSCKDNDEDVKTDLIAQLQKQAVDLKTAWQADDAALNSAITAAYTTADEAVKQAAKNYTDAREQAVKDWVAGEGYLKKTEFNDSLTNNDNFKAVVTKLNTAADDIATLQSKVNDPEKGIDALNDSVASINEKLNQIKGEISSIIKALENLITGVTVNATSTNILGNSMLFPGLNVQFLGAIYGESLNNGTFPDVTAKELGNAAQETYNQNDLLFNKEKAAGKIYFTVNPSNIDAEKLANVYLSLTNSQNDSTIIKLGKAVASKKTLTWGTTRSNEVTLWEADATLNDEEDLVKKLGQLAPAEIFDLKTAAKHVENILKEAKAAAKEANRSNYASTAKTATKEILKETAQTIADLAQAKLPSMPALALRATWADTVGVRNVVSDYSIAATAYKPLDFFYGKGFIAEQNISLDKIDALAERIVKAFANKLPNATKYKVSHVSAISFTNINIQVVDDNNPANTASGVVDVTDLTDDANKMVNTLNKDLDVLNGGLDDVQNLINDVKSYANRAYKFEDRVTDVLQRYLNRVINSVADNGLYKVLQPIMLYQGANGINRFATGATVAANSEIDLIPTTVTNELLAPVYKKFVAVVDKDGKSTSEIKTKGDEDFQKFTVKFGEAGSYTVVYAALDFYGNQIVKRYNVTVK